MTRHEKVLLALAALLLLIAGGLCFNLSESQGSWSEGEVPWVLLLAQLRQILAPPFALVGLACAVGVLFLRAAWWTVPPTAAPEED
jgi:hypothetical protein